MRRSRGISREIAATRVAQERTTAEQIAESAKVVELVGAHADKLRDVAAHVVHDYMEALDK